MADPTPTTSKPQSQSTPNPNPNPNPLPGTSGPGQKPTPSIQPRIPIQQRPPAQPQQADFDVALGQIVMYNSGSNQYPAIVTRVNNADRTYDITVFAPESDAQHRRAKTGILSGHISKEPRHKERPQLPPQPGDIPTDKPADRLHGATTQTELKK